MAVCLSESKAPEGLIAGGKASGERVCVWLTLRIKRLILKHTSEQHLTAPADADEKTSVWQHATH